MILKKYIYLYWILKEEYKSKYTQFNRKFNYLDDGYASQRVVERYIE